jgi:PHD/YefM family antitoxin component YafN of YafNO toxin-antitoxin module
MTSINITETDARIKTAIDSAIENNRRVVIRRGRKKIAAIVSVEDLELLEKIEDQLDIAAADKAMLEPGSISLEELKKILAL